MSGVFRNDVSQVVVVRGPVYTLDEVVEVVVEGDVVHPGFYVCVEVLVEERIL